MKRVLGSGVAVLGLALVSQLASADLFEGLNKAADAVNRVNSAAQTTEANVQSAGDTAQSLKTVAAQQLLTRALGENLDAGTTTKAQLIEMLGQPVTSKVKGKVQTLTFGVAGVAQKLETAQAMASVLGVNTPKLAGDLVVMMKNDRVDSFNLANFSAQ